MLWKYNWHGLARFRAQMTEMVVTVFKTCKYRSNSQLQWRKGKELCLSVDKVLELSKPHSQVYGICKKQLESQRDVNQEVKFVVIFAIVL